MGPTPWGKSNLGLHEIVPVARNPNTPEFFVYRLVADDVPFYVGVGRGARASDRVRYIRYLMSREARGKSAKWSLSGRVVAELLNAGCEVKPSYIYSGLTRAAALEKERIDIEHLSSQGFVLANIQHNPQRPNGPDRVVISVLERCGGSRESGARKGGRSRVSR